MSAERITYGEGAGLRAGVPDDLIDWRVVVPCKVCGRHLTDPRSVMAGVGPRCAEVINR